MQSTLEKTENTWQFQDAQVQFAELISKALAGKPQTVTNGEQSVVIVSSGQFTGQDISGWDSLRPGILLDNEEVDRLFDRHYSEYEATK